MGWIRLFFWGFQVVLSRTFFCIALLSFSLGWPISARPLTPSQILERAKVGKSVEPEIQKTVGNKWVEWYQSPYTEKDIPDSLKPYRKNERINDRNASSDFVQIDMSVLGPYDPQEAGILYAPYIPMPKKAFAEYLKEEGLSRDLSKTVFFKNPANGQEYARFFIHPSKTSSYQSLIDKYGIVRDEFAGFLSASPRSMFVWNPNDPSLTPFVVKSSLHFMIDGDLRINIPQKAARSFLVNDLMNRIPEAVRKELGFEVLHEYAQLLPNGKATSTIYRSIPEELLSGEGEWVPGFALSSNRGDKPSLLAKWLEGEKKQDRIPKAAEMLRSLMKIVTYLDFEEGLKGELHEQNVYFKLGSNGKPTARIAIKDLDSFRVDTELRLRKGKSMEGLRHVFKPFIYSKFGKASGFNQDGMSFDHNAYYYYVKKTFGDSFCKALKCSQEEKAELENHLDKIMAEEVQARTGYPVNPRTLSVDDGETVSGLRYTNERVRADLNEAINKDQFDPKWLDKKTQRALREQYAALRKQKRASATLADLQSDSVYFVLHDGVIEARQVDPNTYHETAVGFASLRPEEHPQTEAFRTRLARLGLKELVSKRTSAAKTKPVRSVACDGPMAKAARYKR